MRSAGIRDNLVWHPGAVQLVLEGRHPWEAMSGVISTWRPTQPANNVVQWGERVSVTVGSVGQIAVQPLTDEAGRVPQVQGAAAMAALQLDRLELALSEGTAFADPEMRQWTSGGSGDTSTFNWSA